MNSVIISNDSTQIVNFLAWIPDCDSHSFALLDLFTSSGVSVYSTIVFPPLGNSNLVVVSVSIDFLSNTKGYAPFHSIAFDYSCADLEDVHNH